MIHITDLIADYAMAILVLLCACAHVAILRAPDINESETIEAVRRIKIAAFAILTLRFWYVLLQGDELIIPMPTQMGLTLLFGAELYRTVYRLFQHNIDAQCDRRRSNRSKA